MENIELWRAKACISWYLQFFSLLFYGVVILFILSVPMPPWMEYFWLFLLIIVLYFALSSQKRLISMGGEIILRHEGGLKLIYNLDEWLVEDKPLIIRGMMFLRLKSLAKKRRCYLVLAHDNMATDAWLSFNHILVQHFQ